MCGIAGYLNLNKQPASEVIAARMAAAAVHRGPDGEGSFVDGPLALGHQRLAIIDLSPAGHQPMRTEDGRFVLVYNGEVYNFGDLRLELESLGHQFRSRCDTEVVLHALQQWGDQALLRFNGMFALALWDTTTGELLLARDRFGIKPLYYATQSDAFLFGSEIKSLLAHPDMRARMDRSALLEYMTFQNYLTDRTLFDGVKILPAGCSMRITPDGRSTIERYWDFSFTEPAAPLSPREYEEEFDRLFRQAVSRQLVSDVPVGSYLSGGIDSGSITALAAPQLDGLTTFTVGFDLSSVSGLELTFDERPVAEMMSYQFKTEHYEMVLKAGDMERCMRRLVWHLEEPRVGQSYPNLYAAQLASKFSKVVLSGAGGDELFGGYPWRYYRAVVNDNFEDYIDKYFGFWQRLIPRAGIERVFAPIWDDVRDISTRDIFRDVFRVHATHLSRPEDYINHSLYFESKVFLHGLLVVEDKLSMANSLETRVPFLDNDLVDFATSVPVDQKLRNLNDVVAMNENEPGPKNSQYFERTNDGKLLLRRAMKRYIPEQVTEAMKQGFSAPDASWFKGESVDYVREVLLTDRARIFEWLDATEIRQLVNEHLEGKANRRLLIWSLLNLEEWCQVFLEDGEPA